MHKIISTTGAPIAFSLTAEKSFLIDPVTPIEVSDEELSELQSRLGSQISIVEEETNEVESEVEVSSEVTAEAEPVVQSEEETNVVEPEEEITQA